MTCLPAREPHARDGFGGAEAVAFLEERMTNTNTITRTTTPATFAAAPRALQGDHHGNRISGGCCDPP